MIGQAVVQPQQGMPQGQPGDQPGAAMSGLVPLGQVIQGNDPYAGAPIIGGPQVTLADTDPQRSLQQREDESRDREARGGLPGHRLLEMYTAWENGKQAEMLAMLKWEEYYHGKQWSPNALSQLAMRNQPATQFNEIYKKVNSYIGLEQRLRRDPKAYPRTMKHEADADAATAIVRYIQDKNNAPMHFSEVGRDFLVRGIGVLYQGVMRNQQGRIDVIKKRVPAINFVYDPRSLEWDFSDCKFLGEWGWYDADDAEDMFIKLGRTDSAEKMRGLQGNSSGGTSGSVPGEFARMRNEWFARDLGRIRLVHIYYRYRGIWWYGIICNQILLYNAPSIYRNEDTSSAQPYVAASCGIDERGDRYGVVKDLVPIQDAINQRHSRLFHLLASRQIVMDKGAVDDVNHVREEANKADGVIIINPRGKDGVDKRFKVGLSDTGEVKGQADLLQLSIEQMRMYGPNTAILGKGEGVNSQSGRAILALQNAGMTELSPVFERHRELKLASYRKDWQLAKQFMDDQRVIAIMDEGAESGIKQLTINEVMVDMRTGAIQRQNVVAEIDVDLTLDEGPDTITQTEEMLDFVSKMGEAAVGPAGRLMIELSNMRNKAKLLKIIDDMQPKPDPREGELKDKLNELNVAKAGAEVDKIVSEVENKRADTLSKMVQSGIPSSAMQVFPFDYGANMFLEDVMGEQLHPGGNAFEFQPPPQMEQVPMQDGPGSIGIDGKPVPGPQVPAMERQASQPQIVPTGNGQNRQPLGQEPIMGAPGGLPMGGPLDHGLMPPPGTRPN